MRRIAPKDHRAEPWYGERITIIGNGGHSEKMADGVIWRNFVILERGVYYIDQAAGKSRLQFVDLATRQKIQQ